MGKDPIRTAPHGFLRVAAACPPVSVADPAKNAEHLLRFIAAARKQGVQVLVFPELCLTGYTAGDLFFSVSTLIGGAERALARILAETADDAMIVAIGLPAAPRRAALQRGRGDPEGAPARRRPQDVPARATRSITRSAGSPPRATCWATRSRSAGSGAPFGTNLLFAVEGEPAATIGVEICEDLWSPIPPSSHHAVAGATVLLNLSASNELVGKAEYRRELVKVQSGRTLSAYVYANNGVHESTTDVVFGGQLLVAENATLLAEGRRFARQGDLLVTDVDVERLVVERMKQTSFDDAVHELPQSYRRVTAEPIPPPKPHRLLRAVDPHPFVPADPALLDERCREVFAIQTAGLAKRLEHTGLRKVTLGLSGGLDSTLALLVVDRTFDLLGLPARGDHRRHHARLRHHRGHARERPRAGPRGRRGPARDRHPRRLRAALPRHRPRRERDRQRRLRERPGPRAHAGPAWTSPTRRARSTWAPATSASSPSAGRRSAATRSRCTT